MVGDQRVGCKRLRASEHGGSLVHLVQAELEGHDVAALGHRLEATSAVTPTTGYGMAPFSPPKYGLIMPSVRDPSATTVNPRVRRRRLIAGLRSAPSPSSAGWHIADLRVKHGLNVRVVTCVAPRRPCSALKGV
jgi:hypothetical protein